MGSRLRVFLTPEQDRTLFNTVREVVHRWDWLGVEGLWEKTGVSLKL